MLLSPTPFEISFLLLVSVHTLAFQVLRGQRQVLVTWLAAAFGFGLGQMIAERFFASGALMFGNVYLVETTILAWLAMTVARRASAV